MKKQMTSKVLSVLLAAALLAGCSQSNTTSPTTSAAAGSSQSSDTRPAGTEAKPVEENYDYSSHLTSDGRTLIRVAMASDPGTYDPAAFGSIDGLNATATMMRESLFERDANGNLINQIAKDYTVDDDNLTYHVEIYDYVYDTAGNHITADDIVFCFTRAKENGFNSTSLYDKVTKDDDYNVTLHLNNTAMGVFAQVVQVVQIYSQKAFVDAGDDFGTKPVFTGPYKLTQWVTGTSIRMEKNEDYWQKEELRNIYAAANVDIIDFYIIKEAAQLAIALETDQIDMVYNMSSLEAERFMEGGSSSAGFYVYDFTNRQSQLMYLNVAKGNVLSDNLALRKAVMHSIDINGVIDGVVNGRGIACKTFGNDMISDYQATWNNEEYFDYDPELAKKYLAESGYGKGEVTLRIMTTNDEVRSGIALMLQAYMLETGINAEILTYENALFNTYKYDETQFDILLESTSWNGPTVTTWRDKFDQRYFENGKNGFTFAEDSKLQELLAEALDVSTYSAEGVNAFHQYLKEQAYARGIFNQISYSVTSDCVVGYMNHRVGALFPAGCTYVWNVQ